MANRVEGTSFTDREEAIIDILSKAFAGMMLDARIMEVHRLNGEMASTIRFNLNEEASADLERTRVESTAVPLEDLAIEVASDLKSQLR